MRVVTGANPHPSRAHPSGFFNFTLTRDTPSANSVQRILISKFCISRSFYLHFTNTSKSKRFESIFIEFKFLFHVFLLHNVHYWTAVRENWKRWGSQLYVLREKVSHTNSITLSIPLSYQITFPSVFDELLPEQIFDFDKNR